jgi:hypothetical protein
MKCFAAYAISLFSVGSIIAGVVRLIALGKMTEVLFITGCIVGLVVLSAIFTWAFQTAWECWNSR